jgi:hypothetical protein
VGGGFCYVDCYVLLFLDFEVAVGEFLLELSGLLVSEVVAQG